MAEYKCIICRSQRPKAEGRPLDASDPWPSWICKDTQACVARMLDSLDGLETA